MKYFLSSEVKIYNKGNRFLILLVDVPYWIIVSKIGVLLIKLLQEKPMSKEELINCLCTNNSLDRNKYEDYVTSILNKLEKDHVFDYKSMNIDDYQKDHPYLIYTAGINVTRNCNLQCCYCYANAKIDYEKETRLTPKNISDFLNGVKKYASPDCTIQFTGGEPLLQRKLLFYGIEKARELGFSFITVNTNGILLLPNDAELLKEYNVNNVTVSLDGVSINAHESKRGKGTYEKALRAIELLKKYNIHVTASMTIHGENIDELNQFLLFCKNNDIQPFTSPLFPIGRCVETNMKTVDIYDIFRIIKDMYISKEISESDLEGTFFQTIILPLKDLVKRSYCGTGSSTVFLDSNCDIYPCTNTLNESIFYCGNLENDSFENIWEKSATLKMLRTEINVDNISRCKNCEIRYICAGYCRGLTYKLSRDIHDCFPWCDSIKKCFIDALWLLGEYPSVFEYFKDKFNRYQNEDIDKFLFLK